MFKVGDKVRCIDNSGGYSEIPLNSVHIIKAIADNFIYIQTTRTRVMSPDRFIKIPEFEIKTEADYYTWLARR